MKKFILAIIALTMAAISGGSAAAQTFTTLHQFKRTDGSLPEAALVQDSTGNLYGTTFAGGDASEGTVFKLSKTGVETILITFNTFNGSFPASSLVFDKAGKL